MFVFVLEAPDTVPEISLSRQAGIAYHPHRTIDGGKPDLRVFLFDKGVNIINRRMLLYLEEYVQDSLSLTA